MGYQMDVSSNNATSSVNSIRRLLEVTGRSKVNSGELLATAGIDPMLLEMPNVRIANRKMSYLTRNAIRKSGNDALGLHIGELTRPGLFDILGHIAMCCGTLKESMEKMSRYIQLIGDCDRIIVDVKEDYAVIRYKPVNLPSDYQKTCAEIAMASLLVYGRWLTERNILPVEVHFQHSQPGYLSEYHRIFGSQISFNQPETQLILNRSVLDYPLNQANPELLTTLVRQADVKLIQLGHRESVSEQIETVLISEERLADSDINHIAGNLLMSVRTLQRRLRDEKTSYRQILDRVRNRAAKRMLLEKALPLEEIASLLGFASTPSFIRSFKRWNGTTPGGFQRR